LSCIVVAISVCFLTMEEAMSTGGESATFVFDVLLDLGVCDATLRSLCIGSIHLLTVDFRV